MKLDEEAYDFLRVALSNVKVSCNPNDPECYRVHNLVLARLAFESLYDAILYVMDRSVDDKYVGDEARTPSSM